MNYRALGIGSGISEMQAVLGIVDRGYEVVLLEKEPSIGGEMAQLSETSPTLDCSQSVLAPRTVDVGQHPSIHLLTLSEVVDLERISGGVGDQADHRAGASKGCSKRFRVRLKIHPRYVLEDKCTAGGDCAEGRPVVVPNEFDWALAARWGSMFGPFDANPRYGGADRRNKQRLGQMDLRAKQRRALCHNLHSLAQESKGG